MLNKKCIKARGRGETKDDVTIKRKQEAKVK